CSADPRAWPAARRSAGSPISAAWRGSATRSASGATPPAARRPPSSRTFPPAGGGLGNPSAVTTKTGGAPPPSPRDAGRREPRGAETIPREAPVAENPYKLTSDQIRRFLPHRQPFLLVDRILEIHTDCDPEQMISERVVGTRVVGIKNVSYNEPYFQGHF